MAEAFGVAGQVLVTVPVCGPCGSLDFRSPTQ
jgi:hypothetical protein